MIVNDSDLVPKSSNIFNCDLCDYNTCRKSQYERHLSTDKHKKRENDSKMVVNDSDLVPKSSNIFFECDCGKIYKYDSGYYRHKKTCNYSINPPTEKPQSNIEKDELIIALLKQNSELLEIVKNGTNITNNTNTNCMNNNKTFNLQIFLNETCKDAMNITDFIETIKLQLTDLEKFGEVGYVEGISNIITTNLKALDVTQRPVHCTDKKRETIYIKDEDKWEKDDDNKSKLRKAIKKVANKNIKMLPKFREKHPDYGDANSKVSDRYSKMVIEAMGGQGNNELEKEDKIIRNISKNILIEK